MKSVGELGQTAAPTARRCYGCNTSFDGAGRYCSQCLRSQEQEALRNRAWWLGEEHICLPRMLWEATFEDSDDTPAVQIGRRYLEGGLKRRENLTLLGPTGTSKSWTAACLVNELLPALRTSQRWAFTPTLLRRLHDFDQTDAAVDEACRTRLLILDDLQATGANERTRACLEEILVVRYEEERPVIITSNLPPEDLARLFSDRVVDRLSAAGQIHVVTGPSRRRRAL